MLKTKNKLKNFFIGLILVILALLYILGLLAVHFGVKRRDESFTEYFDAKEATMTEEEIEAVYEGWYTPFEELNRNQAEIDVKNMLETSNNEEVYIKAYDDVDLYSRVIYKENSDLWVVIMHGYGSNHKETLDIALKFYNEGYNVITPDLRGNSSSGGKYITFGIDDSRDVISWTEFILEKNPNAKIALHGSSMGGASVLLASAREDLPLNVYAVISDCAFTTAYNVLREQFTNYTSIPSFPVANIVHSTIKLHTGVDLKNANPIEAIKNTNLPILFIHGTRDEVIPFTMQDELFNAYEGPKEKLVIDDALHLAGRYVDPYKYYSNVFSFLEENRN